MSFGSSVFSSVVNQASGIIASGGGFATPTTNLGIYDNSPPAITNRVVTDSTHVTFSFSAPMSFNASLIWAANIQVTRSGGDQTFGNGNDVSVAAPSMTISGNDVILQFPQALTADTYRLTIPASQMVMQTAGNPTLGTTDYVTQFAVASTAPALGLTFPSGNLTEGQQLQGTVTRTGDLSQPLIVSLSASPTAQLSLPTTITINAGSSTQIFTAAAISDGVTEASTPVVVTASAAEATSSSATINVTDAPVGATSLNVQIAAGMLYEGQSARGIVSRTGGDQTVPLVVSLSGYGTQLSGPVTVTIAANATSANFAVTAISNTVAEAREDVILTASITGGVTSTAKLRVLDAITVGAIYRADFDSTTGNNAATAWTKITSSTDTSATFNFDYSTVGVPASPRGGGTTRGLRLSANDVAPASLEGITLSPNGVTLGTQPFRVVFDMWLNANGPFPLGGTGSTQYLTAGIGHDGVTNNFASAPGSGSGSWLAVSNDGNTNKDYSLRDGTVERTDDATYGADLTPNYNYQNNNNPYYQNVFEAVDVAGAVGSQGTNQTGQMQAGAVGFKWRQVEIVRDSAGNLTFSIDGTPIATEAFGLGAGGRLALGVMDLFTSVADKPAQEFALIDNVSVEIAPTVTIALQAASDTGASNTDKITNDNTPTFDVTVNQGGTIELDWTGDGVADFTQVVGGAGTYPITPSALVDGTRSFTVKFTSTQGGAIAVDTTDVAIDTTGPRVTSGSARIDGNATFFFGEAIDSASVQSSDLTFVNPFGVTRQAVFDQAIVPNGVRFTFPTQSFAGSYVWTLGPDIRDVAGNLMDSNSNGTNGEATDKFILTSNIASPIPQIVVNVDSLANGIINNSGDYSGGLLNPLAVTLAAGTYDWSFAAPSGSGLSPELAGANFSAWNYGQAYSMYFAAFPSTASAFVAGGAGNTATLYYASGTASTAASAFSQFASAGHGTFTLASATTLNFVIPDNSLSDNVGGVSVLVTRQAVIPATIALDLQTASDSGKSSTDNTTNVRTPTFDLTVNQAGTIALDAAGNGVGVVTQHVNAAGTYAITSPSMSDGARVASATFIPDEGTSVSASLPVVIDTLGPRVTSSSLSRPATGNSTLAVTFDSVLDAASAGNGDVVITGPNGVVSGATFDGSTVSFPRQTAVGTYTIVIGPDVRDVAGNLMDQNSNGINGQGQDAYATSFQVEALGQTIYVDGNASSGGQTGGSWANAFLTLQDALAAVSGQTIRVADGTYKPTVGTDRAATFTLKNGVKIEGGYAGVGASNPDARDIAIFVTTLSGEIGAAGTADNSFHVVTANDVVATAILDGVTVTAGSANGTGAGESSGGGLFASDGSPTIRNVTFLSNNAIGKVAPLGGGGAYLTGDSRATLDHVTFQSNTGILGAGLFVGPGANATLSYVNFFDNVANGGGGAIARGGAIYISAAVNIANSTFARNKAIVTGNTFDTTGGAIIVAGSGSMTLRDSAFADNQAASGAADAAAGAIYFNATVPSSILNTTFTGNSATTDGGNSYGGAILIENGTAALTITGSTFTGNASASNGANRSANGGAIVAQNNSGTTLIGSTFDRNTATAWYVSGGAVYADEGSLNVRTSKFRGNAAVTNHAGTSINATSGGALSIAGTETASITNSIFVGNAANGIDNAKGGAIVNFSSGALNVSDSTFSSNRASASASTAAVGGAIYGTTTGAITNSIFTADTANTSPELSGTTVTYSDVSGGFTGTGNIGSDPLFVRNPTAGADSAWGTADDDYGDLNLKAASPARNAGSNAAVPSGTTTDLAGNPRIVDTTVDMGAYESQAIAAPDLVIRNLVITGTSDGKITVTWDLTNQGTATATSSENRILTSIALTNAQGQLDSTFVQFSGSLAAGATASQSYTYTLPQNYNGGAITATAVADDPAFGNRISESNAAGTGETNNAATTSANFPFALYADLVINNVQIVGTSDGKVTINWILANQGSGTAGTADGFIRSSVILTDSNGQELVATSVEYDGAIAAGGTLAQSYQYRLPSNYTGGAITARVVADDPDFGGHIFEYNAGGTGETNNSVTKTAQYPFAPYPDLVIENIDIVDNGGGNLTVSWDLWNSGDTAVVATTPPTFTGLMVKTTGSFFSIGSKSFNGTLAAFARTRQSLTFSLPGGTYSGPLTAQVTADVASSVAEYNSFGTGETNNTLTASTTIAPPAAPDLVVSNLAITGTADGKAIVSWTTVNQGDGIAAPVGASFWYDRVKLTSADGSFVSNQSLVFSGSIAGGGSAARSLAIQLPSNYTGGALTATVTLDDPTVGGQNYVVESNASGTGETNNTASVVKAFPLTAYADLIVSNLTITGSADGKAIVTWTVLNQGNAASVPVGNPFSYDRVKLVSADGSFTFNSPNGFSDSIAAGGTVVRSVAIQLPDGYNGGALTATVTLDDPTVSGPNYIYESNASGTGETNNTATVTKAFPLTEYADLVVTNLTVTGTNDGKAIVSWTTLNQGNGIATPVGGPFSYDRVKLVSADGSFVSNQPLPFSGSIAAGSTLARSMTIPLPYGYNGGALTATVTLDDPTVSGPNYIYESNASGTGETNNTASKTQPFPLTAYADLVISNLQVVTSNGDQVTVSWNTVNQGDGTATGNWSDRITLRDALGNLLGQQALAFNGSILAGGTLARSITMPLPSNYNGTAITAFVIVDDAAASSVPVFEYNALGTGETNNTANKTVAAPDRADLSVIVPTPTGGFSGRSFEARFTVTNSGTATTSGTWQDNIYLSPVNGGPDVLFGQLTRPQQLAPGQSYSRTFRADLPQGLSGAYRLKVIADVGNSLVEYVKTNNTGVSNNFNITLAPYSDLQVATVTAPPSVIAGQVLTVSWTVANRGQGATDAPLWYDDVYISQSANGIDGTAIKLGSVRNASYLGAGESYSQTFSKALAATLSGTYYVYVVTDATSQQYEYTADDNNTTRAPVGTTVQPIASPANFAVGPVVVAPNTNVLAGQAVYVTWTVKNTGGEPITGTWDDALYLSPTANFRDNGSVLLTMVSIPNEGPLDPNESYTRSAFVTIPANYTGGGFVVVDPDHNLTASGTGGQGAGDVSKSTGSAAIQVVAPPAPSLHVSTVAAPATAQAGNALTVSWHVSNDGFASTGVANWNDAVYLSRTPTLDAAAILVGRKQRVGGLSPAASYNASGTFALPSSLSGDYYVIVRADVDNAIAIEASDAVLVASSAAKVNVAPYVVTPTPPGGTTTTVSDLTVDAVSSPTSIASGTSATVSWTVTNIGPDAVGAISWIDHLYLSDHNGITGAGVIDLGVVQRSGPLVAGAAYSSSRTITVPNGLSGAYHFIVVANANGAVNEVPGGSTNNVKSNDFTITARATPALKASAIVADSTLVSGDVAHITYTVTNAGTGATLASESSWTDAIYLSTSPTSISGATYLGTYNRNGGLNANGTYNGAVDVQIPGGISGARYIIVVPDSANQVYEGAAEGAGNASRATTITATPFAILKTSNVIAPAAALAGQAFTVSWTVTNDPTAAATRATTWYDAVYLSRDQYFDPSTAVAIGSVRHDGSLAPGASYGASLTAALPDNVSGPYYVIVISDVSQQVYNAGNDAGRIASSPSLTNVELSTIGDLATSNVVAPATGVTGQNASPPIQWVVKNVGASNVQGNWIDAIYLSSDGVFDGNDKLIARVQHSGGLAAGGQYTGTSNAALPADIVPGHYFILVRANAQGAIRESDLSNNSAASPTSISLDVAALTIGQTVTGTIREGENVYYRVTVGAGDPLNFTAVFNTQYQGKFYVSYGRPPTESDHDYVYTRTADLTQKISIPNATEGTYYVMLSGSAAATSAGKTYALVARTPTFGISAIDLDHASNRGNATITITGAKFGQDTEISLVRANGTVVKTASVVRWKDESTLWSTFDLRNIAVGTYSLRATLDSQTSTLSNAFTVDHTAAGALNVRVAAPGVIRAGTLGQVTFFYENTGNTDVVAPLLELDADGAKLRLSTGELVTSTEILGINNLGTAGVLPPGFSGHVTYAFKLNDYVAGAANTYVFSAQPIGDLAEKVDWDTLKQSSRPAGIADVAWDAIFGNLRASVGSTVGDLQNALADTASALSELGRYTTSIDALLGFKFTQADAGLLPGALETQTDISVPTAGLSLEFGRSIYASISARNRSGLLGIGWQTPWDTKLLTGSVGERTVDLATAQITFFPDATGKFVGPAGAGTLVKSGANFIYTDLNGTQHQFNAAGELVFIRDKNGNQLTASRVSGLVTRIEHSDRSTIDFTYDASGHVKTATASNGQTATYTYDATGQHLMSVTTRLGTTTYAYESSNDQVVMNALLTIIRPGGGVTSFNYDSQGRRIGATGSSSNALISYDNNGGITFTDSLGNKTRYRLTDFLKPGRLTDARGNVTRIEYDDNGNPTRQVLPGGLVYRYQYNAAGQVIGVVDPLGASSTYTYLTGTNFLSASADARGNRTTNTYDAAGNLKLTTLPGGATRGTTYDSRGLPLVTTNARGQTVTNTYNSAGQLASQALAGGPTYTFTYDANGNVKTSTDASGTTTFTYDNLGRVTHVDYPAGRSVTIEYDALGRRSRLTDGAGYDVRYAYNTAGQLTSLRDAGGNTIASFIYDGAGRLTWQGNADGSYSTRSYDAAGNISSLVNYAANDAITSQFDYQYNAFNQISREQTLDGVWTYAYDAIGQLRRATFASADGSVPNTDLIYAYDAAGNRVSTSKDGVIVDYATNPRDEYTSVGGVGYSYDADGNLLSDGTATYAYDALGRLTGITLGGTTTTNFTYDSQGRRASSTSGGTASRFVLDPISGNTIGEFDASGALQAYNVFGTDGLVSRTAGGQAGYFAFDGAGRTAGITGAGGLVQSYAYDPFGSVTRSAGTASNPFLAAGQAGGATVANGIVLVGSRALSSVLGRSLNASSGLAAGDANVYRYLSNAWASRTSDAFGGFQNLTGQLLSSIAGRTKAETFSLNAQLVAIAPTQISSDGAASSLARGTITPALNSVGGLAGVLSGIAKALNTLRPHSFQPIGKKDTIAAGIGYTGTGGSSGGYQSTSLDPNSLTGPQGYGPNGIVGVSAPQVFRIDFQNVSTATAPAQIVRVEYALDDNWDWRTISLQTIAFDDTVVNLSDAGSFHSSIVDLRPQGKNLLVLISAALDPTKGLLVWTLTSIDPDTGEAPTDPSLGLLPPDNDDFDGRGFVTFTMRGRRDVPTGTGVEGEATITFDDQPPIVTNKINNVLDTGVPTTTTTAQQGSGNRHVAVAWSGVDDQGGSGIKSYDVYVSIDGGEFAPWLTATTLTNAEYAGTPSHSYAFAAVASDNAGNVGDIATVAASSTVTLAANTFSTAHIFYNNSGFDGHDAGANANDDNAIATDKVPLLPNAKATFSNYTSFSKGINGIMIDVAGELGTLSAADFLFRSGNNQLPTNTWGTVINPTSITVRPIAGQPGMNRITIIWPDNAIQKAWLEVTMKATTATGLASAAVFYFGNAIGETHNVTTDAAVTAADALRIRSNMTTTAAITNPYDIDRDGDVDLVDMQLVTGNATAGAGVLVLLNALRSTGPVTPGSSTPGGTVLPPIRKPVGVPVTTPVALPAPTKPGTTH